MDKIIIKDLLIQAIIGVNKGERKKKQNIKLNITMFYDISKCGFSDNIKDTIDYSEVSKKICEYTEESKHYTLEALATGVAKIILFHFNIEEVIIRIDKPSAIYLAKSPAIEIRRNKKFFKNDLIQQKLDSSLNILNNIIIQKDIEHCVYLALGSNIENRYENILKALSELELFSFIKNTSFLYETPPKYVIEQPKFLNLVCMVNKNFIFFNFSYNK